MSIRLVASIILGLLSALILASNVTNVVRSRRDNQYRSFVPLVSGLAGVIALVSLPVTIDCRWYALPLLLDYTWLIFAIAAADWVRRKIKATVGRR